jgi:preprotein translocase subunit SecG
METVVTIIHYLVCIILIGVILMQAGKGADIGAAFGAGGSQTVFGARGPATFLNKLTIGAAVTFLITSLTLAQMAKKEAGSSVVDALPAQAVPAAAGATPAATNTAPAGNAEKPAVPAQTEQKDATPKKNK